MKFIDVVNDLWDIDDFMLMHILGCTYSFNDGKVSEVINVKGEIIPNDTEIQP